MQAEVAREMRLTILVDIPLCGSIPRVWAAARLVSLCQVESRLCDRAALQCLLMQSSSYVEIDLLAPMCSISVKTPASNDRCNKILDCGLSRVAETDGCTFS